MHFPDCQSSPCLTSPPTFIAPVEFLTASCLFSWALLFLHVSRLFGVALHQGDYCPTYNVNHSNTAMHAAMHFISTQQDPPFDIILVQEPWWCEIDDALATVSLTGWQVTLPKLSIPQNEWPRIVAYHRLGMGINLMLRTDIAQDPDFMIMNVGRDGAPWPHITLINIYNQKTQNPINKPNREWTANHLQHYIPHHSTPTIIAGNWNIRDLSWDDGVPAPNPQTREMLEWLHSFSFKLMNKPNVLTREDNFSHASVINLVFANETTSNSGSLSNVYINTEIGSLSDHHALSFTIGPPQEETINQTENSCNWKHADEKEFCDVLKDEIKQNRAEHNNLVRDLLNQNRLSASESKLDEAVKTIQNYLEQAAEKTIPAQQLVRCSKPWWSKDLTKAYKELRESREVLRGWMREFHCPSLFLADIVSQK